MLVHTQFRFRPGHSAEDQLILTYERISHLVHSGMLVDLVLLNLTKAFDVVSHSVLFRKLSAMGVTHSLVRWVKIFLVDHTMRVACGGSLIMTRDVTSGVLQGSVLGPLFFIIYVNSITDSLGAGCMTFADDFKLFSSYRAEE